MKRIKQVVLSNFEGQSRTVDLQNGNLLLGDVGTGKTSVINAIRFGGLGYVPHLGRVEAASARLLPVGADEASVTLVYDDGSHSTMALVRRGESVGRVAEASWVDSDKVTEVTTAIRALYGATQAEAEQHLDMRELVRAAPAGRAKAINAMLDKTANRPYDLPSAVTLLAAMRLLGSPRVPQLTSAVKEQAAGQLLLLEDAERGLLTEAVGDLEFEDLAADLKYANERKNLSQRERLAAAAAMQENERRLEECATPAGDSMEAVKERIAILERRIMDATRLEAGLKAADARLADVKDTVNRLVQDKAAHTDPGALPAELEKTRAAIAAVRKALEDLTPPVWDTSPPQMRRRTAEEEALDKALREEAASLKAQAQALKDPGPPTATSESAVVEAAVKAVSLFENDSSARAMQAILKDLKVVVDGYRDSKNVLEKHQAALAEAETRRRALLEAAEAKIEEARILAAEQVARAEKAFEADMAAHSSAAAEARAEQAAVEQKRRTLNRELEVLQETERAQARRVELDASRDERLEDLRATVRRLEEEKARLGELPDIPGLRVLLEAAKADYERFLSFQTLRGARDEARANVDRETTRYKVLGAVEYALTQLRSTEIGERSDPLVRAMGRFLAAAGIQHEPFIEVDKTRCDFGWYRRIPARGNKPPLRVTVETLSGGETVLFMTALAYAVLVTRQPEISILTVEAAEVGVGPTLEALLQGLAEIAPDLSHVIVATCNPIPEVSGFWALHTMEPVNA